MLLNILNQNGVQIIQQAYLVENIIWDNKEVLIILL